LGCAAFLLLVIMSSASANEAKATPIGKVVELLEVLEHQLQEDATADGLVFKEYTAWSHNLTVTLNRVIEETSEKVAQLQSALGEQEALQDGLVIKIDTVAGALASVEKDKKTASDVRAKERKEFDATQATLVQAIDELERSLMVLGKAAPENSNGDSLLQGASAAQPPLTLSAVAEKLRKTLQQGSGDLKLSMAQRETLDSFIRRASHKERGQRSANGRGARQAIATDFLQVRSQADPEYGQYESQSGSALDLIQSVLDESKGQLEEARKSEGEKAKAYTSLMKNLGEEIELKKTELANTKSALSSSQELAGRLKTQLLSASNRLESTKNQANQTDAEKVQKTNEYRARTWKRSDELTAVQEAQQILTSEAAQRIMAGENWTAPPDFLQITKANCAATRRKALHLLKKSTTPGLALLAIRSQTNYAAHSGEDPFRRVKGMVRSMLEKLQQAQAEDAEHKGWCDSELGKSTKSQADKQADIEKLKDRIGAMDTEIAQLADDLNMTAKDLLEMNQEMAEASRVREQEHARAKTVIAQYKDAKSLLNTAITVIQKYYDTVGDSVSMNLAAVDPTQDYKAKTGLKSGVVGILQIALQDYEDLLSEAQKDEEKAAADFKEMKNEAAVRAAVFAKDLQYRNRAKVKLEADRMRTNADMKNYAKELGAVEDYLAKLQESCTAKGDTYSERKTRREAELQSLKEALDYLNGETVA